MKHFAYINDPENEIKPKVSKDLFIAIIPGVLCVCTGLASIIFSAFMTGAHAYEDAETEMFEKLDLFVKD